MAGMPAMAAPYFREGTDRVVHQNDIARVSRNCGDRMGNGLLPMFSTLHQFNPLAREILVRLQTGAETCDLIGPQGNVNFRDLRAGGELAQGMHQDRRSPNLGELFGCRRFLVPGIGDGGHACPQPRRRNDDYDLHRGLQVYGPGEHWFK
jgi:hypothetical protein